jgi:hypothetical protein
VSLQASIQGHWISPGKSLSWALDLPLSRTRCHLADSSTSTPRHHGLTFSPLRYRPSGRQTDERHLRGSWTLALNNFPVNLIDDRRSVAARGRGKPRRPGGVMVPHSVISAPHSSLHGDTVQVGVVGDRPMNSQLQGHDEGVHQTLAPANDKAGMTRTRLYRTDSADRPA